MVVGQPGGKTVCRLLVILHWGFFVFAASFSGAVAESGTPVIQILAFPDGGFQKIQATQVLVLDAEGFLFSGERGNSGAPPDTIALHILHDGRSFYYSMPFLTGQRRYELSAKTLRGRGGAPPFKGLPRGANAFLLIGTEVGRSSLDIGVFADQWNLLLSVE